MDISPTNVSVWFLQLSLSLFW